MQRKLSCYSYNLIALLRCVNKRISDSKAQFSISKLKIVNKPGDQRSRTVHQSKGITPPSSIVNVIDYGTMRFRPPRSRLNRYAN